MVGPWTGALVIFVPVLLSSGAMQAALLFKGTKIDKHLHLIDIARDEGSTGWLLTVPGMPFLAALCNDLRRKLTWQRVGCDS